MEGGTPHHALPYGGRVLHLCCGFALLPCGGSPGSLDKLGMMGVWLYTPHHFDRSEHSERSGEIQALAALVIVLYCCGGFALPLCGGSPGSLGVARNDGD